MSDERPGADHRSMAAMLRHRAAARPEGLGVGVVGGRQHTFGSWHARSNQVARAMRQAGVGAGDVVAFLGTDAVVWAELVVASSAVRAAAVPLNWRLSRAEIDEVVADARPAVIVVEPEFAPLLGREAAEGDGPLVVVPGAAEATGYAPWADAQPDQPIDLAPEPDDVALIIYTSGTSGRPKGVELPNRSIAANLATLAPWDIRAGDQVLVPAPLFHVSGTGWLFYCLGLGASSLYLPAIEPGLVLELFASGRVDHALTVPAVVQMLVQHPQARDRAYPALRTLIYGGSPMSPTVAQAAIDLFGCELVQSYGMTETCGPITFLTPEDHRRGGALLAAAGRPAPGVELAVWDPLTDERCATGVAGEVRTRTPMLLAGYRDNPEELAAAMTGDGWFRTGDVGYLDDAGYLFLCDRVKDMIVSGGENIYPIEVENVLMTHPRVRDVAVFGVPHERWGETVKAVVVLDVPGAASPDELRDYCRERLAHYKCPTAVEEIEEVPRNPSGKILKRVLKAPYWKDRERAIG